MVEVFPKSDRQPITVERISPVIKGGTTGGRFAGCSVLGQGGETFSKCIGGGQEPIRKDTATSYPDRFEERHTN
jgi:hypothetical protein